MALPKANVPGPVHRERRSGDVKPALAECPICDGHMEVVYNRHNQQVIVCTDCLSGVTVPTGVWEVVRIKREAKWMPKP
jgi:hypothetical protein